MMSAQPTSPRRRLVVWLAVGGAALLVIVAGIVALSFAYAPRPDAGPTSAVPSAAPAESPARAPSVASGVDGCLGGDARTPEAVLAAQASAPHTPEGAVSFAVAFARWGAQKPVVPDNEIEELAGTVITAENFEDSVRTSAKFSGSQFNITSLNGFYRINSVTDDRVELSLMLPLVVAGAIDPTLNFMPSYVVEWTERGWVITGGADVDDANTLRTTGVAIPGGC